MTDLDSLTARVAACLQDATHLVYPEEAIAEGMRQALADLSTALSQAMTLTGLDGATETSLPAGLESLAVQAAAALTVSGRALRHAEQPDLAPEGITPAAMSWAETVLGRFRQSCERLRSSALRGSSVPWPEPPAPLRGVWPLDVHDGETW
jgi:hypothetical protein